MSFLAFSFLLCIFFSFSTFNLCLFSWHCPRCLLGIVISGSFISLCLSFSVILAVPKAKIFMVSEFRLVLSRFLWPAAMSRITLDKASDQILNWRWTFIDVQYSWRMVFLVFKKRNLHILSFAEGSRLNKEVPDIKRATVSVPDPRSQSAGCLDHRQTFRPMDLYLTQLDDLQLGKCVSPKMSYKSSFVGFPCWLVGYKSVPVHTYLTLHVFICLIPKC